MDEALVEFLEETRHARLDFSLFRRWYQTKKDAMRRDARARARQQRKQELEARRILLRRKRKKTQPGPPHPMIRRSRIRAVLESDGVPEYLHPTLRYHLCITHGVSKCATCGRIKGVRYFNLFNSRGNQVKIVAPSCIRCTAMAGYDEDPVRWFCKYVLQEARNRATQNRLPFDIDVDWLVERYHELEGHCELCGRELTLFRAEFRHGPKESFMRNPSNLSLDQREPGGGYTRENVQLVNLQCNMAKLDLPLAAFLDMCRGVVLQHGFGDS